MIVDIRQSKLSLEQAYHDADIGRLTREAILENINTGVIFIDNKGIIMTVNNSANKILDLDCRDFVGKDYRQFITHIESKELLTTIRKISESRFKFVEKEIKVSIGKKTMHLRLSLMAMEDYQNIPMGVLVVFEDLSELIKAQRALAWQEVARRMAHEIKNPLTPIKLSAERLIRKWDKKSPDFGEVFQRATRTIIKEVDSLKLLVDEFSRLGKMPEIEKKPTDLNALLGDIMELYKDCKDTIFITNFQKVPEAAIDKAQIKRFVINLLDNAIQAMAKNVTIKTSYNALLDKVIIEVADDGIGVKKEDKDKLFLPYFSTKKSGTGLGLAIADKIISDHGGHIKVTENEPNGTKFVTVLPVRG
ncbi:MAG TPA: ATP-binding protein [Chitinophagaceae bacterium]|nr:ATP-binding protein [Chitinophagaceae bacterium]